MGILGPVEAESAPTGSRGEGSDLARKHMAYYYNFSKIWQFMDPTDAIPKGESIWVA